jgi:hypothetical protein
MRWARIIGISLIGLSGPAFAQSIDEGVRGLETCFETARLADSICDKQTDPEQRLNCFGRTRAAQLECLKHVLPDKSVTSPEAAPPASPPSAASEAPPPASPPSAASEAPPRASPPSAASEAPPRASPPSAASEAPPPASIPSATSEAPKEVTPKEIPSTRPSNVATERKSQDNSPKADVKVGAPAVPATQEQPTATIQSDAKSIAKPAAPPLMKKDWIISETTSPIDYSALVSAVIRPVQQVSNGPVSLIIRCRAKATELALQFPSDLNVAKSGELQLDFQIDDQPSAKQRWTWLVGGKFATYKGDPVPLLQSIPEGARLLIRPSESGDAQQAATFLLIGLDSVRKRVGTACKWAPLQAGASAPKR